MYWWESVELALRNLGGTSTLSALYKEVRKVRLQLGESLPASLDAVVRKELEYNSSDSTQWHGRRDLFFSVHGKGEGVWGLREAIVHPPSAFDLLAPETESKRKETVVNRIIRDTTMTLKIKALHDNSCQICGTSIVLSDGRRYAEAHHIIPIGEPHSGPDTPDNIIVVCPNHHAMLDLACIGLELSNLRTVAGHDISLKSIQYHNDNLQ